MTPPILSYLGLVEEVEVVGVSAGLVGVAVAGAGLAAGVLAA